jgi:hypothetical protein
MARNEVGAMTDQNREALERLWGAHGRIPLSPTAEYELRTEDFVMELPQSGERVVGRDMMRAMQEHYPAPPSIQIQRIVGSGDLFVLMARSDYSGEIYHVANVVEFTEGRISRETRYYASPFEAPAWREQWVEEP